MKFADVITELESLAAKAEGEAKALVESLIAKIHGDKNLLIAEFERELATATPELQALWAKVKAAL